MDEIEWEPNPCFAICWLCPGPRSFGSSLTFPGPGWRFRGSIFEPRELTSMFSFISNQATLRKKIIGLALTPVLLCFIVFGALVFISSITTARLVGDELTNFMIERTSRACIHGYNTSMVAYGELMDTLKANSQTLHLLLENQGGIRPTGHMQSWQAVNEVTHESSNVTLPALTIGSWQAVPDGSNGPVRQLSIVSGRAIVVFQRIDEAGDMMRVAAATSEEGVQANLGSYIPARLASGDANPLIQTVVSGTIYRGNSYEFGSQHTVACEPERDDSSRVFGMLCMGIKTSNFSSLIGELKGNMVGDHGTVAIFYGHNADRGKMVLQPGGIGQTTLSQWWPTIFNRSLTLKDQEIDGTVVKDADSGHNIIVYSTYIERLDWEVVLIADAHDLQKSSRILSVQFQALLWKLFFAGLILLGISIYLGFRMSKKLIDPMAELTIRLTSNATQIASSARQQAANVANINTSGNEIAAAVKEISATSKELLRSMELLADDAEKTSEVANEGSRGLQGLGSSMQSLSSATHSITDQLTAIRTKANKINSVVTAITKVADQTNLLSLNAAIEAEKAGEGGAGFAVVAREIRRLADQSALATMEIEQMVEAMQEAVSTGVAQTRELTEAMERGIEASESISGQFGDIIHRVESMVPRYEAVHEGMQNQSEGAQQISEAMWQLTEMGRQTSESVNDLNDVSHQLHEAVRILKEKIIHTRVTQ